MTLDSRYARGYGDLADRLSDNLQLTVTPSDVEQNPQLVKLLTDLGHRLGPQTRTKHVHTNLTHALEGLQTQKYHWLKNKLLYSELQDCITDHQLQPNKQFGQVAQECLTYAELDDYLDCSLDPLNDSTLLGLTPADIKGPNTSPKQIAALQQTLIPEVEQRLRKHCNELVQFFRPPDSADDQMKGFGPSTELSQLVESDSCTLENERRVLKKDKETNQKYCRQYYQMLLDSISTMEQLITQHRLQTQARSDNITTEWMAARSSTIYLKIRVVKLQVLCETYHTETVKALSQIRSHLEHKVKATQDELSRASQALKAYEALGSSFSSLAKEYGQLRKQLENKRWALSEMKKSLESQT